MNVPFYVNTCWTLLLASLFISSFRPWDERRSCTNKKSFDEDQRSFFSLKINHLKSRPSILLRSLSINCNVQMFNYDSTSIEYFFVLFCFFFLERGCMKVIIATQQPMRNTPSPLQSSLRALFEVVSYNQNQSNFSNNWLAWLFWQVTILLLTESWSLITVHMCNKG